MGTGPPKIQARLQVHGHLCRITGTVIWGLAIQLVPKLTVKATLTELSRQMSALPGSDFMSVVSEKAGLDATNFILHWTPSSLYSTHHSAIPSTQSSKECYL